MRLSDVPATLLLLLTSLVIGVSSQIQPYNDPLTKTCRRFTHQTTLIDGKIYIDGGLVDYGAAISASTVNYTNTYLLALDYNNISSYSNAFPSPQSLSKPNEVPAVRGGVLWADSVNKYFYLFGGEYNSTTSPPEPGHWDLWQYDTLYDKWNTTVRDSSAGEIQGVAFGAGAVVDDDRALGFYYGGYASSASVLDPTINRTAQAGLLKYDMLANSWSNDTSFPDDTPRAEGALLYIPASDQGMLVYFGGVQQSTDSNGSYTGVPMNQIYIYDLRSSRSYVQTTSGGTPPMRKNFCAGVSWPDDHSSYNIYLYGGIPPDDQQGVGYNDVWILSLPSFTWTQWFPLEVNGSRESGSPNEHHASTCNVVAMSQMIILGGYYPNSSNTVCDSPSTFAQHNLNLGGDNSRFNTTQAEWYEYLPNITSAYQVPATVVEVIGGGPTGGATLTTPAASWGNTDLPIYFTRTYAAPSRTPTRSLTTTAPSPPAPTKPAHHSIAGPVAGGVVGGVAVLLALLACIFCICRRRRTKQQQQQQPVVQQSSTMTELPAPDTPASQHKPNPSSLAAPVIPPPIPSPPPLFDGSNWSPQQQHQPTYLQYGTHAPQQYYPPPPQAQQYYPPPPAAHHEQPPSPISEMPSVRSPLSGAYGDQRK